MINLSKYTIRKITLHGISIYKFSITVVLRSAGIDKKVLLTNLFIIRGVEPKPDVFFFFIFLMYTQLFYRYQ